MSNLLAEETKTYTPKRDEPLKEKPLAASLSIEDNIVVLNSDVPIFGFQFDVDGLATKSKDGPKGFTVSVNKSRVIGFSLQGKTIPKGRTILAEGDGQIKCLKKITLVGPGKKKIKFNNKSNCKG